MLTDITTKASVKSNIHHNLRESPIIVDMVPDVRINAVEKIVACTLRVCYLLE